MKIGYHNKAVSKKKRGSGEIGRRARFRGVWVKPCGFKSHLPHHRMRKPRNEVFLLVQRKQAESRYDQAPGLTDLFVLGNPDGLLFFCFHCSAAVSAFQNYPMFSAGTIRQIPRIVCFGKSRGCHLRQRAYNHLTWLTVNQLNETKRGDENE